MIQHRCWVSVVWRHFWISWRLKFYIRAAASAKNMGDASRSQSCSIGVIIRIYFLLVSISSLNKILCAFFPNIVEEGCMWTSIPLPKQRYLPSGSLVAAFRKKPAVIHRRITSPSLAKGSPLLSDCFMVFGPCVSGVGVEDLSFICFKYRRDVANNLRDQICCWHGTGEVEEF